jgi:hypothetical protein
MWEPRRLTTLWAFTACYRDRFTVLLVLAVVVVVAAVIVIVVVVAVVVAVLLVVSCYAPNSEASCLWT